MKTIELTKGYEAIVDDDDYERLSKFKWYYDTKYAQRGNNVKGKSKKIKMHHEVIGNPEKGLIVDHINGNTLDNRKENLRICSFSNNSMNKKKKFNSKSRYKSVHYETETNKYRAIICIDGKSIGLGRYTSDTMAALAYNKAAIKHFGQYAKLNEIDIDEYIKCKKFELFCKNLKRNYKERENKKITYQQWLEKLLFDNGR